MPGTLYVVGTPIGNLEDITLRALRILREVSLIAAEDTRRTAKLLRHYSISTPTTSYHEHNEREKLPRLFSRLTAGDTVALVADAGMPLISDPGAHLVRAATAAGIPVRVVPGPSAPTAAFAVSGLKSDTFTFLGFPPHRSNDRKKWFGQLIHHPYPIIFFESPHRLRATLAEAVQILGARPIIVARELTKMHEELVTGPIHDVLAKLLLPKGEVTVVIDLPTPGIVASGRLPTAEQVAADFGCLTGQGRLGRRQAIRELACRHGVPTGAIYRLIEQAKSNRSNDQ